MDERLAELKKQNLVRSIRQLPSLIVAFSGGVDSSFLLAVARETLGDRVLSVTAEADLFPSHESKYAMSFVKEKSIRHVFFKLDYAHIPNFTSNPRDRCYYCKREIARKILEIGQVNGIEHMAHAANMDDLRDYRPGMKAAEEMGLLAPLIDAGLRKDEIRFLSKGMGLSTWDKPSMACLASRIPYDTPLTRERLRMVEDAEEFLFSSDFKQFRVRHHGTVARIEAGSSEIDRFLDKGIRNDIVERFREIGFDHVSIDLEGYVTGSMNRGLEKEKV